jgi:uncharacterized membrane protein YidH (DUF202 family)
MKYTIYIVGILALVLGYLRYCRRPASRRLKYHERFRSIQMLEPAVDPLKETH